MVLIEIDGEYWHNQDQDAKRDAELNKLGFSVIRIKAKDKIEDRLKMIFT
jgi:very-short-patch-repair endonuclease